MKNLFSIDTLRLSKKYTDAKKYSHRQILEQFVLVAFHNNGFLPHQFDISLKLESADTVKDVLTDLGYHHVRDIRCFSQTTYICIV